MSGQTAKTRKNGARGFTLIEIIITFALMGVMAAMFATLFTRSFTESSAPLVRLDEDVELETIMENMIADYDTTSQNAQSLEDLKTFLGNEGDTVDKYGGPFEIVDNRYIEFDGSGAEQDYAGTDQTILKVTIKPTVEGNGQALTYLFTVKNP